MPSQREAHLRHVRHYLATLRSVGDLGRQGGGDLGPALKRFEEELPQIESARAWADAHIEADEEAASSCMVFPFAGAALLDLRLAPRQEIRWLKGALAAARKANDLVAETMCLVQLGKCYLALGEARRAMDYLEHCFTPRTLGGRGITLDDFVHGKGEADSFRRLVLNNLGLAYEMLGQPDRALECHEQSLALSREASHRPDEARSLNNLGKAHAALGGPSNLCEAMDLFTACLSVARETGDRRTEVISLCNIGATALHLGDVGHAIEVSEQGLAMAREIGDRRRQSDALSTLASSHGMLGDHGRALQFDEQSLALSQEIGDRALEAARLGCLGADHAMLGDLDRAIALFQRQLTLAHEIGDRPGKAAALGNLGTAYSRLGDPSAAVQCYEQHLALAQELGDRRSECATWGNLGSLYYQEGQLHQALDSFRRQTIVARELGDRRTEAMSLFREGVALNRLGNRAQAALHASKALAGFEAIGDSTANLVREQLARWRE